jgi:signal transduction histidine kinase
MEDISLHIMDIIENSIRADAKNIELRMDKNDKILTIEIIDDGIGMNEETKKKALNPFFSSKNDKKFGLGLSLLSQSAEETGGNLKIESEIGKGTKITATFNSEHIDRKPLGDIGTTLKCLILAHPEINFSFEHVNI